MPNAIIIGATSGIGRALAEILAANNYKVGITGRRTELLEALHAQNPASFFTSSFDVTDARAAIEELEAMVAKLGGLDLLIISAGTGDLNEKLDFEIEQRTIATNVQAFTKLAGWAFNYFQQKQNGHLVAISSVGGLRGSRHAPAYNASKAYQVNYLEGLRQKATKLKLPIYITDIRPGFVKTAMAKGEGQFWIAPVEKAAQQIFNAIQKKKRVAYITRRWQIIAALLKILPRSLYERM